MTKKTLSELSFWGKKGESSLRNNDEAMEFGIKTGKIFKYR